MRNLDPLLDAKTASKTLNISVSTLRRWTAEQRIPYVKLGRRALYRVGALIDFIRRNERPAGPLSRSR